MNPARMPTVEGEGNIRVTSRVFQRTEDSAMRSVPTFELQFVPVRQSSVIDFPLTQADRDELKNSSPSIPGCMRGIQAALAIEAVIALMFYGFWQLSHLLR
jgi:hypothetical protein